ncbi:hypothetical protein [Salinibacter ruber]|uniref:hypothetical protein n=1 Tax=Salinibacter ruber TaxID=146919 RepID=UPI00216A137C|nr:hypothetical protein [Salinibacter ruber]MCS3782678.1 hypothetical protein [Salinibacter ruber]
MSTKTYPYGSLYGNANLDIENVLINCETDRTDSLTKFDKRNINLFECAVEDWEDVSIKMKVSHSTTALKEDLEADPSELSLTAVTHCSATNVRQTVPLSRTKIEEHTEWTGSIVLPRTNYRGKVELGAIISAEVDGTPHRYVGDSNIWTVWFDDPPAHSITGNINISWKDFSDPENPPDLTEFEGEVFYLDLESEPTLFLNKSFEGLPDLLESESKENPHEAAFRESEFYGIARAVWVSLFNASASSIAREDGRHVLPDTDWKRKVLKKMLPELLPESSKEDALRQVYESFQGNVNPWIQSKVLIVADRLIEASAALRSSLQRIERQS